MALYDKYYKGMFAVAKRYINQSDVAEDAMQDSFIKAFQKLDQYHGEVAFGCWLKRIVVHTCLDALKAKKIITETVNDELFTVASDPVIEVEDQVSVAQIKQAIALLSGIKKTILNLFLFEGYDHEEISQILSISVSASRTYLHRGKKALINELKAMTYERY